MVRQEGLSRMDGDAAPYFRPHPSERDKGGPTRMPGGTARAGPNSLLQISPSGGATVSMRSMLVEPGRPNGTPAVTTTVSPRRAMRWARAMSRAVEQISSTCASCSLTTEYTPPGHGQSPRGTQVRGQAEDRRLGPLAGGAQGRVARLGVVHQHRHREDPADPADRAADRIGDGSVGLRTVDLELDVVVRLGLHLADDLRHHLYRLARVLSGGGFRRKHHRVGAGAHRGGYVGHLGAGRGGGEAHRLEHLGGHHHRLAELAADLDDAFLDARHALRRHLYAEVAARHHDRVGALGDRLDGAHRAGLLDLGHEEGLVADQPTGLVDVLRALHEGQRHPVDPQFQAEGQVAAVLVGQRAELQHRFWHVDALAIG